MIWLAPIHRRHNRYAKGVMLSHRNVMTNAMQSGCGCPTCKRAGKCSGVIPFFMLWVEHLSHLAMMTGHVVLLRGFRSKNLRAIQAHRVRSSPPSR